MLDRLLEKKLDDLKGKDILVVMNDGLGFLGQLKEYDKNTLILEKVLQSQFEDIDWKKIPSRSKDVRKSDEGDKKIGYANWSSVNLKEVYIRVEHVTRIWPWIERVEGEEEEGKRPIYYEKEYM
ncbi:MAG: hypothetical protein KGY76_06335 [Candidatus Thermoplasmatota archaeon]|nr:hypothetical protein [Candidatus Thermoplasmatota archaeon]